MPRHTTSGRVTARPPVAPARSQAVWKLEDAKARFSEVVRRARSDGPQRVTVRGKDAVVVIAADVLDRLLPAAQPRQDIVSFLQGLHIDALELTREPDTGRDFPL